VSVTASNKKNVCVLAVDGELIGANVKEFRELVRQAVAGDSNDFVVDFSKTGGIDSEGLEALTELKRERDENLGLVKLCHQSETLRKIFEITRVNHQFEQYELLDDALESFG